MHPAVEIVHLEGLYCSGLGDFVIKLYQLFIEECSSIVAELDPDSGSDQLKKNVFEFLHA